MGNEGAIEGRVITLKVMIPKGVHIPILITCTSYMTNACIANIKLQHLDKFIWLLRVGSIKLQGSLNV